MKRMKNTLSLLMKVIFGLQTSFAAADPTAQNREVWYDWKGKIVGETMADSRAQVQPRDLAAAPALTTFVNSPLNDGDHSRRMRTYFDYPRSYGHAYGNWCYPVHRNYHSQPRFFLWYSRQGNWGLTGRSPGAVWQWHR